jgi:hypothetical protein
MLLEPFAIALNPTDVMAGAMLAWKIRSTNRETITQCSNEENSK